MKQLLVILACLAVSAAEAAPEYLPLLSGAQIRAEKLGNRCTFSGAGLESKLIPGANSAVWNTVAGKGEKERWSALGIEFQNPRTTAPAGFRLEVTLPRPVRLNIEPRINKTPGKGFWATEWLGRRSVELSAGKQTLEFTWGDLNVKSADWNRVNAVTFSVAEPYRMELHSFGLLYPEPLAADAPVVVNWLDAAEGAVNPVARPFDKLTGVFSLRGGGGLTSRLEETVVDGVKAALWQVQGKPGAKGWAVYGFGFIDPIDPPPSGLRFEVVLPEETALTLNVCKGFSREKGFYAAKKSGQSRKVVLPVGRQFIDFDWAAFGVPEQDRELINSVEFVAGEAGKEMAILKVDMIFADVGKAAAYRLMRDRKLNLVQRTMLEALEARGVPWRAALNGKTPQEIEPCLWTGIMLAAQREQLNYFKTLFDPETAGRLLAENAVLIETGKQGGFNGLRQKSEELQKSADAYVDAALASLPPEKRRFVYDPVTEQFRYPDGREFRMFGPHFFRALYSPGLNQWRPWDMRYLAGLGFNGIRLHVIWQKLEPEQGKFDPAFLGMLKDIVREAERYGFGVSVDLHWPYPDWFNRGKPGYELNGKLAKANSYHWPEALEDSWRRLGAEFAELPNIVAFEVPTNETPIGSDRDGLAASRYLLRRWNEFLKSEYGTRENLQAVWGAAADGADRYGLAPGENWDDCTIRPLGFQDDASPDQAYESNPRFYDHLRFAAMMQKEQSGRIVAALRETRPDAYGMFQRTIGDMWDRSPVPVDYRAILTSVGEHVLPGTHYNMGGVQARKAATLTRGSYDSEQQMEGSRNAVERHVALGLGFCPFAFHFRGGGGMLLADDDWHLKPEVGYLPKLASHIRTFRPVPKTGPAVAVIVNARLEASTGAKLGDLIAQLEERGCRVGVFETLRIIDEPALLDGYALAVTATDYADLRLLDVLRNRFKGKVLLNGRLDLDSYARRQDAGLPAYLVKNGLLLKSGPVRRAAEHSGRIDLAGSWEFIFLGPQEKAPVAPPAGWKKSETVKVPGMWGETGMTGSLQYRIGDGACRRSVVIPAGWKGRPLKLKLGAVDDLDWVFWNGKLIGHTGEKTPNYWMVSREYAIPEDGTNFGGANELVIIVRNLRDDGGIWKAPIEITGSASGRFLPAGGGSMAAPCGGATSLVVPEQLADGCEVLARFRIPGSAGESAAFVRQGRFYWYFSDQEFHAENPADRYVLDQAVSSVRK